MHNCGETTSNALAMQFCQHYGLIPFAGTDNHRGPLQPSLAGVCCESPIVSVEDFIQRVKDGQTEIFY